MGEGGETAKDGEPVAGRWEPGIGGGNGDGQSELIQDTPRSRIRIRHCGMREMVSGPKT